MFFIGLSNLRSPTIIPQLLGFGVAGASGVQAPYGEFLQCQI